MTGLVEMKTVGFIEYLAHNIFCQPKSVGSSGKSHIFTFRIEFAVCFLALPVIYTVLGLAINRIFYFVLKTCDLAGNF